MTRAKSSELDEIEELLSQIRDSDKIVIVEGIKDRRALREFGIENVITLNKPVHQIVDQVSSEKEVVILTDLDSEGRQLYSKLKKSLDRIGVRVDNRLRELLFKKTELRQIEGLAGYLRRIGEKRRRDQPV